MPHPPAAMLMLMLMLFGLLAAPVSLSSSPLLSSSFSSSLLSPSSPPSSPPSSSSSLYHPHTLLPVSRSPLRTHPLLALRGGGISLQTWTSLDAVDKFCANKELNDVLLAQSESNTPDTIPLTIESGADVNCRGVGMWTPLHFATRYGRSEAVSILAQHKANLELRSKTHFTPLHHAAMRGHTETVRVLAEHGADLFARTAEGFTPMDWAERNGHIDTMLLLHDLMANHTNVPYTYGKERRFAANGTLLEEKPIRDPITEYKLLRRLNQDPWRMFSRFEWEGRVMPPIDPPP